ncbi:MAG TPA: S8 family serine peptidase [Pseudonocardiaceae bacterium]|nr:S8 family serine peptidase [Pseudonocardiaceae bacterium]
MGAAVIRWLAVGSAALLVFVAAPVTAAAAVNGCSSSAVTYRGATPWAENLIDPWRIWPLSTGTGVTVAVIGTGVDARNPQLAGGTVLPQIDLLNGGAIPDCNGWGTFAAGIVAAQHNDATTFVGVAPGAHILPIRYTQPTSTGIDGADPAQLAVAINRASDAGAKVILVVVPSPVDSPDLDAAVQHAHDRGALIVSPAAATQAGVPSYPTATTCVAGSRVPARTPCVLAVGGVDSAGSAVQTEAGDYVSVAAPGADLVSTSAGTGGGLGHLTGVGGAQSPYYSAAYVAGVAALLWSYQPALTQNQVVNRITSTASHPADGHDAHLGWGVVNAYAAVAAPPSADLRWPGTAIAAGPVRTVAPAPVTDSASSPYRWVGIAALLCVVLAALIVVAASAVRRGRARGWRLGRLRLPER